VGCAAGNSRRQLKGEYRSRSKLPSRGPYTDSETLRHRFTTAGIHEPPYAPGGSGTAGDRSVSLLGTIFVQVGFPHPHSSLAAGHNKNPNGLIGQFLPKRTDLSPITPPDLQKIERKLNGRPRKTLG
jgi:hypothetical protein